ncbi:secretion protein HlyD [Inquilinus sp. Marseille-Q2685]|uniref:secretion protein HlyD n=1 Tax=Inquilinus sp. Marseille-Q2685 TaxID=2866581 RepID=UPI001CE41905|nr:secretion protein HlyD [Inquilinus sp. Marseille-Q2685]
MRTRIRIAVLVLIAAAVAAAWWFDLPGRLGWREAGDGPLTLYGNVDIRQAELGFRVSGRLVEMKLEEGEAVTEGQVLARLDDRPFQDSVAAARADVAARQADLDKLIAGPRAAEIAQGRATVAEREADLENAKLAFARAQELRQKGNTPQSALDQAQADRDMAQARLDSACQALALLLEGSRAEDIAAGRANLAAAQADLATAETSLADATLKASADGIILSRVAEPGAIMAPSSVAYVLSLTRPVWIRAYVAEPDLGRVHPGLEVEVVTDTRPDRPYRARVGFVSPVAEFTPKTVQTPELRTDLVYRLRIIVDEPDPALRQGMPVTVRVPREG